MKNPFRQHFVIEPTIEITLTVIAIIAAAYGVLAPVPGPDCPYRK